MLILDENVDATEIEPVIESVCSTSSLLTDKNQNEIDNNEGKILRKIVI